MVARDPRGRHFAESVSLMRRALGGVLLGASALAAAQTYPTKPVRLIVPYAAGNTDTTARIFGAKLAERLNQQVIIDNRPGAGANIGAEIAARSTPDGYVLFYASLSHAIVLAWKQKGSSQRVELGAIAAPQSVMLIQVRDEQECPAPEDSGMLRRLAASWFEHAGQPVAVLDTAKLFSGWLAGARAAAPVA